MDSGALEGKIEHLVHIDYDVVGAVIRRAHLGMLAPYSLEMSVDADRLLDASTLDPRRHPGRQSHAQVQELPGDGWVLLRLAREQLGASLLADRFGRSSCRLASLRSWVLEMELPYAVPQTAHVHAESTFGSVFWLQFPMGLDDVEGGTTFLPAEATGPHRSASLAGGLLDILVFPGWLPHFPASAGVTGRGRRLAVATDLLFTEPSGQPVILSTWPIAQEAHDPGGSSPMDTHSAPGGKTKDSHT